MSFFARQDQRGVVRPRSTAHRRPAITLGYEGEAPFRCCAPRRRGFGSSTVMPWCGATARRCYVVGDEILPHCTRHAKAADRAGVVLVVETP